MDGQTHAASGRPDVLPARRARRSRLPAASIAAALSLAGILGSQLPVSAAPAGWSGPNRVIATQSQPHQSMAVDGSGKTHIAAEDGSGIVYATNAGGSWSECRVSDGDDHEPSIAVGGGLVHVAFARRDAGQKGIYTASGNGGGGGACGWDVVSRHAGTDSKPSLAAAGGTLHIAFRTSDHRLRYMRGAWDDMGWTVLETVDGTCCQSEPAVGLTSDGSPRIAYGDSSGDGLKYAVRSGSSWKKRRVQSGRVNHVALNMDYTPDPWNGLRPANAPSIAYVVERRGTYRASKAGSGVTGAWATHYFGRYFAPPDLAAQSNKSVIVFGQGGDLWATSFSGGIYVGRKISSSGKDSLPQIALYGVDSIVTFARGKSGEGVYRTSGYL